MTVKIVFPAGFHVERTVNRPGRAALGAIEFEIPAVTALVTVLNSEVTSKVHMEGSVCVVLHEFTALLNKNGFKPALMLPTQDQEKDTVFVG